MLAVKLQNEDAVKVMTDAHCSAKLNSMPHLPSPYELACSMKQRSILEILMVSVQKYKQYFLELHKLEIFRTLESLPDFLIDLHFECQSNYIPFLNYVSPSDTYKIYKRGSSLRLDMTLIGFKKLQSIRGNLTVIYKGRGQNNEGELLLIDHDRKSVNSIFEDTTENKVSRDLDNILKDEYILKKYKPEQFNITKDLVQGKPITKNFESFKAHKYTLNTVYTMTKYKQSRAQVGDLKHYQTFDDYIN